MKDKQGREFDPEIHVTDDEGNPVLNKDDTLKCKTGLQLTPGGHVKRTTRRKNRDDLGSQMRLGTPVGFEKRKDMEYRWVNESNMGQRTGQDDYDRVPGIEPRDVGGGEKAYFCEIRKDWFEENQSDKRRNNYSNKVKSLKLGEGEYSPRNKDTALEETDRLR